MMCALLTLAALGLGLCAGFVCGVVWTMFR